MALTRIAPPQFDAEVALAYATPQNFTGRPIFRADAEAWLHPDAALCLGKAVALAKVQGLRLRIFDAFRPQAAQWALWNHTPDPNFIADPRRGSPHSRGAAVDLTLLDARGQPLEMGTPFDDFTMASHHGSAAVSAEAQKNRFILLGLMTAAGWDFYRNEWWHYQLFDARAKYPLIEDADSPVGIIPVPATRKPVIRSDKPDRRKNGVRAGAGRRDRRSPG
jgi:D-alanyl-D-alanine dipeptidase